MNPAGEAELALLNPAGRLLWEAYAAGHHDDELARRLAERLRIALDIAHGHVRDALEAWRRAALIDSASAVAA